MSQYTGVYLNHNENENNIIGCVLGKNKKQQKAGSYGCKLCAFNPFPDNNLEYEGFVACKWIFMALKIKK